MDGQSLVRVLHQNFNFLKECLKSKELWKKLSDEEKDYCIKAKEKMKRRKQEEQDRKRRTVSRKLIWKLCSKKLDISRI